MLALIEQGEPGGRVANRARYENCIANLRGATQQSAILLDFACHVNRCDNNLTLGRITTY
jgi:hypothetical protein